MDATEEWDEKVAMRNIMRKCVAPSPSSPLLPFPPSVWMRALSLRALVSVNASPLGLDFISHLLLHLPTLSPHDYFLLNLCRHKVGEQIPMVSPEFYEIAHQELEKVAYSDD